jgi:hypothetical protein
MRGDKWYVGASDSNGRPLQTSQSEIHSSGKRRGGGKALSTGRPVDSVARVGGLRADFGKLLARKNIRKPLSAMKKRGSS